MTKGTVIFLLKPGKDPALPKSFRPIALVSILRKLHSRLCDTRIRTLGELPVSWEQGGFRPGRSASTELLRFTLAKNDLRSSTLHCAFLDISAAFDAASIEVFEEILKPSGTDEGTIRILTRREGNATYNVPGQRKGKHPRSHQLPPRGPDLPALVRLPPRRAHPKCAPDRRSHRY